MLLRADARCIPLRDGCVQTVVTSPPYFGLRDYQVAEQIGLESSPEAYVAALTDVFRDVWHVLRDDGTLWLNLGDSYDSRGQILGIPWRVALALSGDGWLLWSEVVWSKPIGAPAGGARKPLRTHEQIFLLSKTDDYYYDADAVREPLAASTLERYRYSVKPIRSRLNEKVGAKMLVPNPNGRHRRSVWVVTPTNGRQDGEHQAAMPRGIIEPCLLAGSRLGDLVFDPFGGTATVGQVAERLGRKWVCSDLAYQDLAKARTAQRGIRWDEPMSGDLFTGTDYAT